MVSSLLLALAAAAQPVPGSGPHPVVMEERAELPGFTVYRPATLGRARLPVVAWANGGCANLGNSASALLGEIASHGYLVVAIGPVGMLPERPTGAPPPAGTPEEQLRARVTANGAEAPTKPEQLSKAIDWATAANRRGALAGRIDVAKVAVAGHSCGGLQAISASSDSRVRTTIALNSGVFDQPRVKVDKAALARLHAPIAYFIGGSGDIAYVNAEDDFRRIDGVPVFKVNNDFGHGNRLRDANGGPTAKWVVQWLDWQLKGSRTARAVFAGADCILCRTPGWTVERKRLD